MEVKVVADVAARAEQALAMVKAVKREGSVEEAEATVLAMATVAEVTVLAAQGMVEAA